MCPPRLFDKTVHLAEAEAGALPLRFRGDEGLEGSRRDIARHSRPGVGNGDHHILTGNGLRIVARVVLVEKRIGEFDGQTTAIGHCVAGIDGQIENGVFQLPLVDHAGPQAGCHDGLQFDALAQCSAQQIGQVMQHAGEVDGARCQRLASRKGQELSGQPRTALDSRNRALQARRYARIRCDVAGHQIQIGADDLQQIVEIVGNAAGELANGLHLLRLAERHLGLYTLGYIQAGHQKTAMRHLVAVDFDVTVVEENIPVARTIAAGHQRQFLEARLFALVRQDIESFDRRSGNGKLRRKAHAAEEIAVEGDELAPIVEDRHAVADIVQGGLQQGGVTSAIGFAPCEPHVAVQEQPRREPDNDEGNHGTGKQSRHFAPFRRTPRADAPGQKALLLGERIGDHEPQRIHLCFARFHRAEEFRRRTAVAAGDGQGLPQRLQTLLRELTEFVGAPLLRGIVSGHGPELLDIASRGRKRRAIGPQKSIVAGDEITALAGFGILRIGEDFPGLVDNQIGVGYPVLLGALAGEENVGKQRRDEQQKDDSQARQEYGAVPLHDDPRLLTDRSNRIDIPAADVKQR